ncbi:DUF1120 domain-containing protein [Pseudomonas sp. PDM02]|jgi:hypothetical protein|uniref:DUF1120 domain-containing protein n=1 Tax=Pseudomonas sp. PDM02 TaxID=2769267 RepID=UPI00177EF314|nr:DUF1120 domain-containing protein [Pseudomonas sp. PDM02]MBD9614779.1 DUF1120 domain-containing protein [Pseudomonas sp. PDM02]
MFKKYFAALSATALIGVAPYALAASSTDLTVTGLITPNACTPTLSGGGIVDIGKISAKDLKMTSNTLVNTQPMQLTVACNAANKFALNAIDNRAATSLADNAFGLGETNAFEKLGMFQAVIKSALADGKTVQAIYLQSAGYWPRTNHIGPGELTSVGAGSPIPVKDLTMELEIQTYIARADSLTLIDEVTVDGSATFEMKYL